MSALSFWLARILLCWTLLSAPFLSTVPDVVSDSKSGVQQTCARDPHEPHYTVQQIAAEWGVDAETVRNIFIDEPGVLDLGKRGRKDGKRNYSVLRIPESVLLRVYEQRTVRKFAGCASGVAITREKSAFERKRRIGPNYHGLAKMGERDA